MALDEVAAHADEFAQQRQIVDLLRQFARGEQALPVAGQPREIGRAAQFPEALVALEIGLEGDRGDHRLAVDQREDALEHAAMDGGEEMIGPQRHGHFFHDAVVDQHRTEEGGLGLDIGGKRANVGGLGGEDGLAGGHTHENGACPLLARRAPGASLHVFHSLWTICPS
jgi:hypothetical protein